jgi:hypothetical protein
VSDDTSLGMFFSLKLMSIHVFFFFTLSFPFYMFLHRNHPHISHSEIEKILKNKLALRQEIRKYVFKLTLSSIYPFIFLI